MTSYLGLDPDSLDDSVFQLFEREAGSSHAPIAALIRPTDEPRLHLLPASTALSTVDRMLGAREGMGLSLARAVDRCRSEFAHVLIDCPAVFGVLMLNALAASETLLVPVQTEFLALKGLERMLHTLRMVQRSRPVAIRTLIVPTMFDRRTRASQGALETLRQGHPQALWSDVIPIDTKFRDASLAGYRCRDTGRKPKVCRPMNVCSKLSYRIQWRLDHR